MQAFTVRSAAFSYPGRTVFHSLSLDIPAAALTVLVGSNGAGKSTLLSLLAGIEKPHAGRVTAFLPGRPALVVQHSAGAEGFPATVRGAVTMGRWGRVGFFGRMSASDRRAVDRAMERLGILDLAGRPMGELSGGQRQRALVAQGLAQEADVLLLDEPAAGLDEHALDLITEALRDEAARGTTVVQATHDLARAQAADHCVLLADGRAARSGQPRSVLADNRSRFEPDSNFA